MKNRARYRTLGDLYARTTEQDNDCLLWQGTLDRDGYGQIHGTRGHELAHRRAWELAYGIAIPEGFDVRHTCGSRACVLVEHLDPTPHRIHSLLRSDAGVTCARGHNNWQVRADNGRRICRECQRLHARTVYWANPERERARSRARYWTQKDEHV